MAVNRKRFFCFSWHCFHTSCRPRALFLTITFDVPTTPRVQRFRLATIDGEGQHFILMLLHFAISMHCCFSWQIVVEVFWFIESLLPVLSEPAITCLKLTIETLEQLWTYFTPCSSVSIVNFEQVNAGWDPY